MTTLCQSNGQQRKMWAWTFLPSWPFSARGTGGLRALEVGVCGHRVSADTADTLAAARPCRRVRQAGVCEQRVCRRCRRTRTSAPQHQSAVLFMGLTAAGAPPSSSARAPPSRPCPSPTSAPRRSAAAEATEHIWSSIAFSSAEMNLTRCPAVIRHSQSSPNAPPVLYEHTKAR